MKIAIRLILSEELGYKFMDTDDYFWLPTNPRYTTKRSKEERLALMKKEILENENVVISGSLVDWGDELIPFFTLAIRNKFCYWQNSNRNG